MHHSVSLTESNEKIAYIRNKVPYFSVEYQDEYLHFYHDGTQGLSCNDNKVLHSIWQQHRYDDYAQAFIRIEEKIKRLQAGYMCIRFLYDTDDLLLEFQCNE